jgi:LDH2 family malate/lactate/ureidoglycolate dehydrogenase
MAIDLSKLGDTELYEHRVEAMIDEIKSSKKAVGTEKIYYPGEIENEKYRKCLDTGYVEIDDGVMADIEKLEKRMFL